MKLKDFNFNVLRALLNMGRPVTLCVMEDAEWGDYKSRVEGATIGETLRLLPREWANREIKETRWYFDTFIIELKAEDRI